MKIIIVGAGKGALIHYNSYIKLGQKDNLFIVDITGKSSYFKDEKIYMSIEDVLLSQKINTNEIIADVVVPMENFYKVIQELLSNNVKNIIVEKPFILNNINDFNSTNLLMVQNYLYSKIFNYIKNYVKKNNLVIKSFFSCFTKNRKDNTLKMRGMDKKVISCFNIEMPHQIYMYQELINGNPALLSNSLRDMDCDGLTFKGQGSGMLIIQSNNITGYIYSNLTSDIIEKNIIITASDNMVIEGNFFTYTPNLEILRYGNVKIFKKGKLIFIKKFKRDDMFTYMLQDYLNYFEKNKKNNMYRKKIEIFSNFYNKYFLGME